MNAFFTKKHFSAIILIERPMAGAGEITSSRIYETQQNPDYYLCGVIITFDKAIMFYLRKFINTCYFKK
jgi:hypothetical protein